MDIKNMLSFLSEFSKKNIITSNTSSLIIAALTFYTAWVTTETADMVKDYSSEYAYHVVEYGLREKGTDDEVKKQIKEWHDNDWGAQIGAVKTLCGRSQKQNNLDKLMNENLKKEVCRLSN